MDAPSPISLSNHRFTVNQWRSYWGGSQSWRKPPLLWSHSRQEGAKRSHMAPKPHMALFCSPPSGTAPKGTGLPPLHSSYATAVNRTNATNLLWCHLYSLSLCKQHGKILSRVRSRYNKPRRYSQRQPAGQLIAEGTQQAGLHTPEAVLWSGSGSSFNLFTLFVPSELYE